MASATLRYHLRFKKLQVQKVEEHWDAGSLHIYENWIKSQIRQD